MKRITLLLSILSLMLLVPVFGQTIDFTKRYVIDNIRGIAWQPGTDQYSYIDDDQNIILVNAKNGKETTFLAAASQKAHDISSPYGYEWLDANTLYFPSNHKTVNVVKGKITTAEFDKVDWDDVIDQDVKNKVFVIKNDKGVFVESVRNGYKPVLLCPDTGKNIVFGESVHRSEWGINEGQYISPNGNFIAFYRMDESMVEDYPLVNTGTPIATVENIKYPMAGRTSHVVTLGIFDVAKSAEKGAPVYHYIQTDKSDGEFLTNVTFSPDEKYIYISHLNREQNHAKLIRYDLQTGKKLSTLIEERDNRYVEPTQRMIFMKNGDFLWFSDRDGWNHLYWYSADMKFFKKVVDGNFDIIEYYGMDKDEKNIYFTASLEKPVNQYVCKVNLNTGIGKNTLTCLAHADGVHRPVFSESKNYFIDYFSNPTTPRTISLVDNKGKTLKTLLTAKSPFGVMKLGDTQIFPIVNKEGDSLWCRMITPPNMDKSKKYPVFMYVYGGPHSQLVTNQYLSGGLFLEFMAQQGYIVFTLDNRGTDNRGAEFEKCIHRNLGVREVEDQMCGVEYLKSLPYVDADRIGLDGWSYGGFMVLSLITSHPDVFKAASCGGPVVNWEWYEVMYGERYMDTPQENPSGYENANIIPKIKNVKCPLLVMHGAQDHTVVQQHTLELLRQAVSDDIELEYFVYTVHDHNVIGPERRHLYNKLLRFHNQNTKGE
ncbi:MAG: DPP IV N-terminal domain-containing protein [Bacteroidales bacterium]|nr:DPP IV N-terminal domain-containing protein [Bacteroidales bacterium]